MGIAGTIFRKSNPSHAVDRRPRKVGVFATAFAVLASSIFMSCGDSKSLGATSNEGNNSQITDEANLCEPNTYKCKDNTLFRCQEGEQAHDTKWESIQRCDRINALCNEVFRACISKEPENVSTTDDAGSSDLQPQEICETREVKFNCGTVNTDWSYWGASCGLAAEVCYCYNPLGGHTPENGECTRTNDQNISCAIENLCSDDSYSSPVLWSGQWVKAVFANVNTNTNKIIFSVMGKRQSPTAGYLNVAVDNLPSQLVTIPSSEICEPVGFSLTGSDLTSSAVDRNVAEDGVVNVNLIGYGSILWVSKVLATFCYPVTKP